MKMPAYCRVKLVSDGLAAAEPVSGPDAIAATIGALAEGMAQECFWAIALDARRRAVAIVEVSRGSLTQTIAHPREVFRVPILANAAALAVAHNHPSGDPTPSPDDKALTRRLREAGEVLGIPLLDHLIVGTPGKFYSFSSEGWPC